MFRHNVPFAYPLSSWDLLRIQPGVRPAKKTCRPSTWTKAIMWLQWYEEKSDNRIQSVDAMNAATLWKTLRACGLRSSGFSEASRHIRSLRGLVSTLNSQCLWYLPGLIRSSSHDVCLSAVLPYCSIDQRWKAMKAMRISFHTTWLAKLSPAHIRSHPCLAKRLNGDLSSMEIHSCQLRQCLKRQVFPFELLGSGRGLGARVASQFQLSSSEFSG